MAISKNSIVVKTYGRAYEERDAAESGIYPGMLCKVDSSGTVIKHDVEGEKTECLVALEDRLQGALVSTAYTSGAPVRLMIFRPGEEFCGYLEAGQKVSIGELLISSGNGYFKSAEDSGSNIEKSVATALEAEDTSAHASTATLIHMRAL